MAKTYSLIQTQTLTGSAASVTFSNIPQNFTDLKIVISGRTNRVLTVDGITIRFNGDTTSGNYSGRRLFGSGSSAGTDTQYIAQPFMTASSATANTFGNAEIVITNYTGSTAKIISFDGVGENNATLTYMGIGSGIWSGTAAITSIAITPETGTSIEQGSTFYLYGIGAHRASGGTITSDANFTYHTFTSSGTFTALEKINNAEIITLAGGGGGGQGGITYSEGAGGGGAGALVWSQSRTLVAGTTYTAIIGAGGAGRSTSYGAGSNGSNSNFFNLTAIGGGGGSVGGGGQTGGCGGGGGADGGSRTGGPSNQIANTFAISFGRAGGQGFGSATPNARGGGGGGGVGETPTAAWNYVPGFGGDGLSTFTNWGYATNTGQNVDGTYWYGGGGAGGGGTGAVVTAQRGGRGGGGASSNNSSATAGTANTGGGGGGCGSTNSAHSGGTGGSGIVIVRYPNVE